MDTRQVRDALISSEALPKRLQALHLEAFEAAVRSEFPSGLGGGPKAIMSLIPIDALRELRDLEVTAENALLPVGQGYHLETLIMIEGVLHYSVASRPNELCSYALTHRTGRIDVAWEIGCNEDVIRPGLNLVWAAKFEQGLIASARHGIAHLTTLGVAGPWFIFCSLAGLRGHELVLDNHHMSEPAWRDQVHLPAVRMDVFDEGALPPQLKAFWRAFGVERPGSP
jgi:hypothetical protein